MKKAAVLATLGVALLAAQAHAQTSVTVSGTVDAYAGSMHLGGATRQNRVESGGLSTPQINFDGVEDLGGGMKAEFALGMFLRTDTGAGGRFDNDPLFGRRAFAGLKTDWGTVRLGRQTSNSFLNMLRTNSLGDSAAFSPVFLHTFRNAIGQGAQFLSPGAPPASRTLTGALGTTDSAWNNALGYVSPTAGGVTVSALYAPGEVAGVGNRKELSVFYANGPLNLALAVDRFGAGAVPPSGPAAAALQSQTSVQVSGAYAFDFARVSAGYFNHKRDYASVVDDRISTVHLGASLPVGPGALLLQTAHSRQSPSVGSTTKRTTTTLAYDYNFSRRTDAYVLYMNDRFASLASGNSLVVGIRHRF
ncbi:porin [Polaromonas hydrogenivorans]|uniref:Porin n=1 Tax=Polaromonas hydrogenivorans TaxID=335476 RepID=A0AAU7LS22_9BURK